MPHSSRWAVGAMWTVVVLQLVLAILVSVMPGTYGIGLWVALPMGLAACAGAIPLLREFHATTVPAAFASPVPHGTVPDVSGSWTDSASRITSPLLHPAIGWRVVIGFFLLAALDLTAVVWLADIAAWRDPVAWLWLWLSSGAFSLLLMGANPDLNRGPSMPGCILAVILLASLMARLFVAILPAALGG